MCTGWCAGFPTSIEASASCPRSTGRTSEAVAAFTREDIARDTASQQLPLAAAWQSAVQALAAAEASYAPLLGPYYAGAATDFDRLGRALTHAADAVHRAHGQDLRKAASHIGSDALPNPAITALAAEARQALSAWQATLAPRPATATPPGAAERHDRRGDRVAAGPSWGRCTRSARSPTGSARWRT